MKVIRKGIMPDGTKVQIEDWSEDYSFHSPADTVAAYPKAKCTIYNKHWDYPKVNNTFRADFTFEGKKDAERAFEDLISGNANLKDFIENMRDSELAECL